MNGESMAGLPELSPGQGGRARNKEGTLRQTDMVTTVMGAAEGEESVQTEGAAQRREMEGKRESAFGMQKHQNQNTGLELGGQRGVAS